MLNLPEIVETYTNSGDLTVRHGETPEQMADALLATIPYEPKYGDPSVDDVRAAIAAHIESKQSATALESTLFVLGASDPEMAAIERLLTECKQRFVHATNGWRRVSPGNMYEADLIEVPADVTRVVFVECQAMLSTGGRDIETIVCDHHRPGDPGYGLPPEQYFQASSIGQVCRVLGLAILYSHRDDSCRILSDMEGQAGWSYAWSGIGADYYRVVTHGMNKWPTGKHGMWDCIVDWPPCTNDLEMTPDEVLFTAAADHCLAAAYQGRCPGVDPDELMRWRAESRAKFQGRYVDDVLADIEAAKEAVLDAEEVILSAGTDNGVCITCDRHVVPCRVSGEYSACGCPRVADMRTAAPQLDGRGPSVPELPEAALRLGESYLAGPLLTPDGRHKLVISGTAAEVEAFRDQWAPANGLTGVYAMPERGMGGGYLS